MIQRSVLVGNLYALCHDADDGVETSLILIVRADDRSGRCHSASSTSRSRGSRPARRLSIFAVGGNRGQGSGRSPMMLNALG